MLPSMTVLVTREPGLGRLGFRQTGARDLGVAHTCDRGADDTLERRVATSDVDPGDTRLLVGDRPERDVDLPPAHEVRALAAVTCCPHAAHRGFLPAAHTHGVPHSDVETGVLREARVGLHADAEDDEVGFDCALVGDDALRLERLRALAEAHVDPVPPQSCSNQRGHVGVEGTHHLRSRLQERDLRTAMRERLGHLEPDVAPAHDDDVLQRLGRHVVKEVLGVVERLHTMHVVVVDAGEVGPDRNASSRDQRLVETEPEGAVVLDPVAPRPRVRRRRAR